MITYILPVYNGCLYIKRAIDSILSQKYCDEVIVINDGSTDETSNVLATYSKNDRVKVVDIENSGVSNARNVGIKLAKGKYIRFVDADDFLPDNSSEILISHMTGMNMLSVGSSSHYTHEAEHIIDYRFTDASYEPESCLNMILEKRNCLGVCDKIFLRELIHSNKILFDSSIHNYEDFLFLIRYIKTVAELGGEIHFTSEVVYNYTESLNSATRNTLDVKQLSFIDSFITIETYLNDKNKLSFLASELNVAINYLLKIYDSEIDFPLEKKSILKLIRRNTLKLFYNPLRWSKYMPVYVFFSLMPSEKLIKLRKLI